MIISYTESMNTLAERLKFIFENNKNLNKTGLWKACKLSSGAITHWFNGETKELKGDNLINAANYLGVNAGWLANGKGDAFKIKESIAPYEIQINDVFTKQLLFFYDGMSLEHKDDLLKLANQLYDIDNPNNRLSNPYPVKPNKHNV